MNIYKLTIQYKGSRFLGFQIQKKGLTIQGEINSALKIIAKSDDIKSIASGRTDAGVHAFGQVVRVELPVSMPGESLLRAMNSHLPPEIRVVDAIECDASFHPIFNAKSKIYHYVFCLDEIPSCFLSDLMTYFPKDLNIVLMNEACKEFVGEFDFSNYQCTGTDVATSVRTIYECEISRCESTQHWGHLAGNYYVLSIKGNGFLKQMVRLIMGALVSVGKEKVSIEEIRYSLRSPIKNRLGPTAPAQGLYLLEVHY